jgi:hypothetical protein
MQQTVLFSKHGRSGWPHGDLSEQSLISCNGKHRDGTIRQVLDLKMDVADSLCPQLVVLGFLASGLSWIKSAPAYVAHPPA